MGYGYGVWLVIQDFNIQRMVRKYNTKPHIAHITVMCNMSDTDAFKLARELKGNYSATILNRYVHFNKDSDKYSDNDNDLDFKLIFVLVLVFLLILFISCSVTILLENVFPIIIYNYILFIFLT